MTTVVDLRTHHRIRCVLIDLHVCIRVFHCLCNVCIHRRVCVCMCSGQTVHSCGRTQAEHLCCRLQWVNSVCSRSEQTWWVLSYSGLTTLEDVCVCVLYARFWMTLIVYQNIWQRPSSVSAHAYKIVPVKPFTYTKTQAGNRRSTEICLKQFVAFLEPVFFKVTSASI